jgi:hypothetical protein
MMMSGVGPQNARMTNAKSIPLLLIWTWRKPFWVISTGSSVQILVSWRVQELQDRMQGGGFAGAGGDFRRRTNRKAWRRFSQAAPLLCAVGPAFSGMARSGQDTHDHVFNAAGREELSRRTFDVEWAVFF